MTWLEDLVEFSHSQVDEEIREILWLRGVSNDQIDTYQIGYLNKVLPDLEEAKDFQKWCGHGSKLEEMFVLPLTTATGKVGGFQFRSIHKDRKGYMDFFQEKSQACLFGLKQAMPSVWTKESIWLVEGAFDLFPIQRSIRNVVATLTARAPDNFIRLMKRLVVEVNVVYDRDATGRRGSERFKQSYQDDFTITDNVLPMVKNDKDQLVKDPSELWEVWGDDLTDSFFRNLEKEIRME